MNTAIRRWLCQRYGHKFYVGSSGYYAGLPQRHCWRCGKDQYDDSYIEPLGKWFS